MRSPGNSSGLPGVFALAALAALAGGCAGSAPMQLAPPAAAAVVTDKPAQPPAVTRLPVCIAPAPTESVGVVGGRKVFVTELDQWLGDALRDQSDRDVEFLVHVAATPEEFAAAEAPVRMVIEKAYLHSVYDSKSAVVVVRVEHAGQVEYFRGQDTGLNWLNNADEMLAALTKAMRKALDQARPRLAAIAAVAAAQ